MKTGDLRRLEREISKVSRRSVLSRAADTTAVAAIVLIVLAMIFAPHLNDSARESNAELQAENTKLRAALAEAEAEQRRIKQELARTEQEGRPQSQREPLFWHDDTRALLYRPPLPAR